MAFMDMCDVNKAMLRGMLINNILAGTPFFKTGLVAIGVKKEELLTEIMSIVAAVKPDILRSGGLTLDVLERIGKASRFIDDSGVVITSDTQHWNERERNAMNVLAKMMNGEKLDVVVFLRSL